MADAKTPAFTAASFYQFISEGKLMGSRCQDCRELHLPPRAICPGCHSDDLVWQTVSGKGTLAAFTSIFIAPTFMIEQGYGREAPYLTGIVRLDEGPMISARILGLDAAQPQQDWIGLPLEVEYLQRGEGETKTTDLAFRAQ